MGGTANGLFKRALTGKAIGEVTLAASSWESFRITLDVNRPVTPKLAVRVNGLWEDSNTWRMSNTIIAAPARSPRRTAPGAEAISG